MVEDAFPGLTISQPTKMIIEPVAANPRWFVLRKSWQLMAFDLDDIGTIVTYLNLSGQVRTNSEGGLLGMAMRCRRLVRILWTAPV
jgi:hypothetical protein